MAAEAVGAHAHVCRLHPLRDEAMLCAIRGTGRTLDFALRDARETGRRLYLLYLREQAFMTEHDARRK